MVLLFGVLLALLAVFVDSRIRPIVKSMAEYHVKVFAAQVINTALIAELEQAGISYDELVHVSSKADGAVSSIQADVVGINALKARMSAAVLGELEGHREYSLQVPLGTLLGNEFLSGRGPLVEIKIIPDGYLQSEVTNQFISAGINQTLHQILLQNTVQLVAIMPGYRVRTETTCSFLIAETVIVGEIPEAYTQIAGDGAPLISKINDYAAGIN